MGEGISANRNVLVCWSGLANCRQKMGTGRQIEAEKERVCAESAAGRGSPQLSGRDLVLCAGFPSEMLPGSAVWACSLK